MGAKVQRTEGGRRELRFDCVIIMHYLNYADTPPVRRCTMRPVPKKNPSSARTHARSTAPSPPQPPPPFFSLLEVADAHAAFSGDALAKLVRREARGRLAHVKRRGPIARAKDAKPELGAVERRGRDCTCGSVTKSVRCRRLGREPKLVRKGLAHGPHRWTLAFVRRARDDGVQGRVVA